MIGSHTITHWCRLQDRVALSSGEAELYSGVRGLGEVINLYELILEMDPSRTQKIEHFVDVVACKGVLLRHGAGQLKHLETKTLWVQERNTQYGVRVKKISREDNPADVLANPGDTHSFDKFLKMIYSRRR